MDFPARPHLRVNFDHSTTAPGDVRSALSTYLAEDWRQADLFLTASELVTNVVRHTGGGGTLELYDGPIVFMEVHDFDSTPVTRRNEGPDGGFGLHLVNTLADTWGSALTPTGKVVWAAFVRTADDAGRLSGRWSTLKDWGDRC